MAVCNTCVGTCHPLHLTRKKTYDDIFWNFFLSRVTSSPSTWVTVALVCSCVGEITSAQPVLKDMIMTRSVCKRLNGIWSLSRNHTVPVVLKTFVFTTKWEEGQGQIVIIPWLQMAGQNNGQLASYHLNILGSVSTPHTRTKFRVTLVGM